MKVTILDREALNASWGHGNPPVNSFLRTIEISDHCECGQKRGEPTKTRFCEDEEFYYVDTWTNPCGHIDKYKQLLTRGFKPAGA